MSDPLIVRSVVVGDRAQWEPLWDGYNTFYERTLPIEITNTTWSRFFDADEPVHALVAERNGHETNATAMRLYDKVAERSGFVVYRKLL